MLLQERDVFSEILGPRGTALYFSLDKCSRIFTVTAPQLLGLAHRLAQTMCTTKAPLRRQGRAEGCSPCADGGESLA